MSSHVGLVFTGLLGYSLLASGVPILESCEPVAAPTGGNIPILMKGYDFAVGSRVACRFDNTTVRAEYIDEYSVQCVAPAHQRGKVGLYFTNDKKLWSKKYDFEFFDVPFAPVFQETTESMISLNPKSTPTDPEYELVVSWIPHGDNGGSLVELYRLEMSYDDGEDWQMAYIGQSETTTVRVKPPSHDIFFRVFAHNAAGWSEPSKQIPYHFDPFMELQTRQGKQ